MNDRFLMALAAVGLGVWLNQRAESRERGPAIWVPSKPRKPPEPEPGLSAIDANRLRDEHGYEGRHRSPGQRAGVAKLLHEDTDA